MSKRASNKPHGGGARSGRSDRVHYARIAAHREHARESLRASLQSRAYAFAREVSRRRSEYRPLSWLERVRFFFRRLFGRLEVAQ